MRLAVLSDIHGNLVALEAVLADLQDRAPDQVINLGDCVTSPLWLGETFARLEQLAIPTVRGNHDRWLLEGPREKIAKTIAEATSPHARYAIATRRRGRWSVELIALEYDWAQVTQQAVRNGREDWATAFAGRS
jgi:hypothetical protein